MGQARIFIIMGSAFKTTVLLGGLTGLFLLIGGMLGGSTGMVVAFLFAVVMNVGSYWFSDKIVLRMYRATEVGPDHPLHRLTARLAQRAGLPMPKVYTIPDDSPNAFATGRDPEHAAVAATEGILRMLPENELEGVIAHELTHVKNRDTLISTVAATIAGAIIMLASMARWAAFLGGGRDEREGGPSPLALIATALLAPVAAGLIQMAISRQREFAADRGGADIAGTPTGLAQALRHIDAGAARIPMDANPATAHMFIMKPFSMQGMMGLFSSHPPTDARIEALMRYRPGQPSR
jgi:heat shock protein HtpX